MTTELQRPVVRKTAGRHRGRQLIVTLYPGDVIGVRHIRTRQDYTVPLAWVYDLAVKAHVAQQKAEKKKARQARAKGE